jgi:hypothetical protein
MNFMSSSIRKVLLGLGLATSLAGVTGCHSVTGTVSHDPTGYFSILGAADGDVAIIDGGAPVPIRPDTPIVVVPGKHRVQVSRGGTVVMDREVLVSDLQTLELRLP